MYPIVNTIIIIIISSSSSRSSSSSSSSSNSTTITITINMIIDIIITMPRPRSFELLEGACGEDEPRLGGSRPSLWTVALRACDSRLCARMHACIYTQGGQKFAPYSVMAKIAPSPLRILTGRLSHVVKYPGAVLCRFAWEFSGLSGIIRMLYPGPCAFVFSLVFSFVLSWDRTAQNFHPPDVHTYIHKHVYPAI